MKCIMLFLVWLSYHWATNISKEPIATCDFPMGIWTPLPPSGLAYVEVAVLYLVLNSSPCVWYVIYVSCLSCFLVCSMQPCGVCWTRANLLALLCVVFCCVLSLSHVVIWVGCGTWLYWVLIFAFLLTFIFNILAFWCSVLCSFLFYVVSLRRREWLAATNISKETYGHLWFSSGGPDPLSPLDWPMLRWLWYILFFIAHLMYGVSFFYPLFCDVVFNALFIVWLSYHCGGESGFVLWLEMAHMFSCCCVLSSQPRSYTLMLVTTGSTLGALITKAWLDKIKLFVKSRPVFKKYSISI